MVQTVVHSWLSCELWCKAFGVQRCIVFPLIYLIFLITRLFGTVSLVVKIMVIMAILRIMVQTVVHPGHHGHPQNHGADSCALMISCYALF